MDNEWLELRDKRNKLKKSLNKKIGQRLKILAEENKMTNTDFGTAIGLLMGDKSKESTVSKYFSGEKELDIYTIMKISQKFKVSVNWILAKLPLNIREDKYYNVYKVTRLSEHSIIMLQLLNNDPFINNLFEYLLRNNTFLEFLISINNYRLMNIKTRNGKILYHLSKKVEAIKNDDIEKLEEIKRLEEQGMTIFEEKSSLSMEVNISQNYCKEPYVEVTLEEALDGALLKVSRLAEQLAKEFTNQNDTNDNKKKK